MGDDRAATPVQSENIHLINHLKYTLAIHKEQVLALYFIKEIVSNNTSAITRKINIGKFSYIIRKPAVAITKENVKTIMLLEILKDLDSLSDINANASESLKKYISSNKIKKSAVDKLLPSYPLRTYKAIYDLELSNVFL